MQQSPDAEQRCSAVLVNADDIAYEDRARIRSANRDRLVESNADLRASLAVRPQVSGVLARLASELAAVGQIEEGAEHAIELFLLDPVGDARVRQYQWWHGALTTRLQRALAQGDNARVDRLGALLERLRSSP